MENSVRDLWSIMNFALPGYLGTREDFRERYEQPLARGAAPDVQRRLSRRLQPFLLRRRKRDVAKDLPEKIEQVMPCDLTSAQRSAYDALLREIQQGLGASSEKRKLGREANEDADGSAPLAAGLLRSAVGRTGRSKRTTVPPSSTCSTNCSRKLSTVGTASSSSASSSRCCGSSASDWTKLGMPFCYLDGATKDRRAVVERFQNDAAIPVFLISLKAGGVGLNLSAADTVIHFDPWWNPAVEAQATDRAHRIGQTRVVTAYKLITRDTVEEKILRLQEKKRAAIDAAIESEEPLMNGLTTEELEELLA